MLVGRARRASKGSLAFAAGAAAAARRWAGAAAVAGAATDCPSPLTAMALPARSSWATQSWAVPHWAPDKCWCSLQVCPGTQVCTIDWCLQHACRRTAAVIYPLVMARELHCRLCIQASQGTSHEEMRLDELIICAAFLQVLARWAHSSRYPFLRGERRCQWGDLRWGPPAAAGAPAEAGALGEGDL